MQPGQTIVGIDEAGRGCVIGPLVVAGVAIAAERLRELEALGVRDSKRLTRTRREQLSAQIERVAASLFVKEIGPSELEENLTEIELRVMAQIVQESRAHHVILDLPVGPATRENFIRRLRSAVGHDAFGIIAENRADARYPIVSAASIIAKVHRDRAIERLRQEYGDFGWGYPGEPKTRAFLREFFMRTGQFPDCARRKWRTLARLRKLRLTFIVPP
jgi:ribonuclease HII